MATKRRPGKKKRNGRRTWLLLPVIILVLMVGWLYRNEIMDLAMFRFKGIDFTRPIEEKPAGSNRITEKERKELEKILKNQ